MYFTFSSFSLEQWLYDSVVLVNARKNLDLIVGSLSKHSQFFSWEKETVFRFQSELEKCWAKLRVVDRFTSSEFTLCNTLLSGKGNCLGLTTVYIAISEILNLPFRPVLYEGHMAIVLLGNNFPFYFDATRTNIPVCDKLAHKLKTDHHRILAMDEFAAVHLSNQAIFFARHGFMDDAIFLIDSALEIFPDYTAGWINRAVVMKKLDNVKEMQRSLDKAKSLNPGIRYSKTIEQIENNE
jgi:tetratricopeptide (TPR) repeat protein